MNIYVITSFSLATILFASTVKASQALPLEVTLPFKDKAIFSSSVPNVYEGLSFNYDIKESKKIFCHFSHFTYKGWLKDETSNELAQVNETQDIILANKSLATDDNNLIHVSRPIGKITVQQIEEPMKWSDWAVLAVYPFKNIPTPTVSCRYEDDVH